VRTHAAPVLALPVPFSKTALISNRQNCRFSRTEGTAHQAATAALKAAPLLGRVLLSVRFFLILRRPQDASGGPAGGQTVAFDPREQGDGLRPKPLPHSGSVSRSEGIKRLSRHKRCPLRATPHLFHGSLDPLSTRKPGRRTTTQAARGGVFSTWPCYPLAHPLKTRCRPVSGRLAHLEPGGGRKAPLFVRRLADNEPKARPQPSRTRCFTPKRAPDLAAVRYENHLRIVSVSCIISVLIRYTSIRYERSNDHGASGNYF